MLKIIITGAALLEKKGNAKATGKPYHMRDQIAHAFMVAEDGSINEWPDKFEIPLDEGQEPYPKGSYNLHPSSLYIEVDAYGHPHLAVSKKPRLVAIPAATSKT